MLSAGLEIRDPAKSRISLHKQRKGSRITFDHLNVHAPLFTRSLPILKSGRVRVVLNMILSYMSALDTNSKTCRSTLPGAILCRLQS